VQDTRHPWRLSIFRPRPLHRNKVPYEHPAAFQPLCSQVLGQRVWIGVTVLVWRQPLELFDRSWPVGRLSRIAGCRGAEMGTVCELQGIW